MKRQVTLAAVLGLMAASNAHAALPGQPDTAATLPGLAITIDVLANDGLAGPVLSKALTKPTHGTARWVGTQVLYTPAAGFHGTDFFRYSAITRSGRAANQKVTISVDTANGLNLTLSGRAKAGEPLANATVTADVGALHYSTQTDAQGNYALPVLGLDDAMVALRAQGSGAQANIVLKSTLGELGRLGSEAGDGVLTRDEDNQVQLTELSTALAYTLEYANGGVPVANEMIIELASRGIDLSETMAGAVAARAIGSGEYPLPGGVADTDTLIRSHQSLQAFFQSVFDGGDFDAIGRIGTELLQDPDVVMPSQASDFIGNVDLVYEYGNPQTISVSYYQGNRVRNNPDGTGRYVINLAIANDATHWAASGAGIRVTHDQPYSADSFPFINGTQVRETFTLPRYDIVRAARIGGRSIDGLTSHATYTYPDNPEIPTLETDSPGLSFASPVSLPYAPSELTSKPRTFKTLVPSTAEYSAPYGASFFTFNANGSGRSADGHYVDTNFSWAIDGDGSLRITYPNGDTTNYMRLDRDGIAGEGVMGEFHTAQGVNVSYGLSAVSDGAGPFTVAQLSNSWASGLDLGSTRIYDNDGSLFVELDGAGQTGANVTVMPGQTSVRPLSWAIDNGGMHATYYADHTGKVPYCQIGVNGCAAQYARRWTPISRVGNRVYVLEELYGDYNDDFHVTDDEMDTQRIMFYDIGSP